MPIRKESVEDKWMKKIAAGKTDILEEGYMICQSCGFKVLAKPDGKGKVICPRCNAICRGFIEE